MWKMRETPHQPHDSFLPPLKIYMPHHLEAYCTWPPKNVSTLTENDAKAHFQGSLLGCY